MEQLLNLTHSQQKVVNSLLGKFIGMKHTDKKEVVDLFETNLELIDEVTKTAFDIIKACIYESSKNYSRAI